MNFKLTLPSIKRDISSAFISSSLILYPATVLLVPKMNGMIYGLFVLVGLAYIIRFRGTCFFKVTRDEKLFYLSIVTFFFTVLFITVNAGFVYKHIGKYLHLLLAIPIYIYLRHSGIRLAYLWYGLVVGGVAAAGVALYDVIIKGASRAQGLTHPIVFGDLALVMGFMSLAGLGWFKQRSSWQVVFPLVAILCGVLSSVLSQARGGWVAIPFLIITLFWYIKPIFSFKLRALIAVFIVILFGFIYAVPQTKVSYQVDRTIKSLQQYSESEIESSKRATSVGTRLEMWQASWLMFLENPVLGVGWGHYLDHAKDQVDRGLRNESAASFDHPHNQFFTALASGGVLGFSVTVMLFFVPVWLFVQYIKQNKTDDIGRLALAGLVLVVAYMAFGLSEPLLDRSRTVNFFAFYLVIIMAAVHGEFKRIDSDEHANSF